jgi:hypothetical protein
VRLCCSDFGNESATDNGKRVPVQHIVPGRFRDLNADQLAVTIEREGSVAFPIALWLAPKCACTYKLVSARIAARLSLREMANMLVLRRRAGLKERRQERGDRR